MVMGLAGHINRWFRALVFPGGPGAPRSSAHVGTGTAHLEIDLVKDGATWCSPVDATFSRPVNPTGSYEIALCLSDATSSPAGFNLDLIYDDTLNNCPEVAPADFLDDNPDANAGSTTFTTPALGTGWNCNYGGVDPPVCDKDPLTGPGKGRAYMQCGCTVIGCATLSVGAGTSKPIAVVTMKAIAAGVDSISLDSVSIINEDGIEFVSCYSGGPCVGATDTKLGPATATFTATPVPPTETPTPTATATSTPLPTPYADIDKIEDTGWCDTVDAESTEVVGDSHSLAVCAHNMPDDIGGFDLHIAYDSGLDGCTEIDCTDGTCVNDNPELAGDLGAGWDCTTSGQPECNVDSQAYIHCSGPASIQSGALAVLNLDVIDDGIDNVVIDSLVLYTDGGLAMAECGAGDGAPGMPCDDATDTKVHASPTPTETATPVPPTATATPPVWAYIDKIENGDGWCDIVNATSTETVGQDHTLAVCLGNVPSDIQIEGFSFDVTFDADLDQCVEAECGQDDPNCLDSNPRILVDSIGSDWDCEVNEPPRCGGLLVGDVETTDGDGTVGAASIWCERLVDNQATIDGISFDYVALAAIDLKVVAAGTDHVAIRSLDVWGDDDMTIGYCGARASDGLTTGFAPMTCQGATDTKTTGTIRHRTPTPKPTATREPTVPPPPTNTPAPPPATPTPLGGVGTQLVPPETGSGSTGGAFSWLLALLAGTAGIAALAGGGFYLRFARRRVT
jgi:hypothetical protein